MAGILGARGVAWGVLILLVGCTRAPEEGFGFDGGGAAGAGADGEGESEAPDGDGSGSESGGEDPGGGTFGELDDDATASDGDDATAGTSGDDAATTGETVALGGGCDAAATTNVQTEIISAIYSGSLRSPGGTADAPHGSIWIAAPGDLCDLTIALSPDAPTDSIGAVLRDHDDVAVEGAACSAAAGQPCTIELPDGPGEPMALRLEIRDEVDGALGSLRIDVSATTEGLADAVPIGAQFRGPDDTDFVLWPVGPATGSYAYDWATDSAPAYNVGVISASGALSPAMNTTSPNLAAFPTSGTPQGWYVFAASTTDATATGDAWTFTVVP